MMIMKKKWIFPLLALFTLIAFINPQRVSAREYPKSDTAVTIVDNAVYNMSQTTEYVEMINTEMAQATNKVQVGVLVLQDLEGQTIEEVALNTARLWRIGFEDNYSLLFVFSINDRETRIETSDNLSTALTDGEALIYLDLVKEDFRAGMYDTGTKKLIQALYNEKLRTLSTLGPDNVESVYSPGNSTMRAYATKQALERSNNQSNYYRSQEYTGSNSSSAFSEEDYKRLIIMILVVAFYIVCAIIGKKGGASGNDDDYHSSGWDSGSSGSSWSSSSSSSSSSSHSSSSSSGWSGGGHSGGGASSKW